MAFWIAATGIGVAVTAMLLAALLRARPGAAGNSSLRVYRDQLREVDRDLARAVIGAEDAGRLRAEIGRRVLDADRARSAVEEAPRGVTRAMAALVAVVMLAGVWGYWRLGAPGYPDLPMQARLAMAEELHATRPGQAEAEAATPPAPAPTDVDAGHADLMIRLRSAVADRPDDLTGQQLLAQNEARLGNYAAAIAAQGRVIALKGDAAVAADHAARAELMIRAAGGYVSPEAEADLVRALERDPANGMATYYAGLMFLQTGRPDRTFGLWAPLLDRSAPGDPWEPVLRSQMVEVAARAGVQGYALPSGAPGPDAAAVAAAADMSAEDRDAMVRGMVAQLNDRLATEGGPAADWARLIESYGVLGATEDAARIWAEAQTRFAGRAGDLAVLRDAARTAGVLK